MHMSDALISPAVAGTMYACSGLLTVYSAKRIELENERKIIPVMGVMGAVVFSAQMINFSIPGTGSSGHLCGGVILSALLGPYAAFLTMIGILLIQCLMFADGGLLALGCNIFNMAAFGCFIGGFLIWKPIMKNGFSKKKIIIASVLASVITLQFGAFSVTLQTLMSGVTSLPFSVFAATMLPIHLVIGAIEGAISAAVLVFIYEVRPELLWDGTNNKCLNAELKNEINTKKARLSFRNTIIVLAVMAIFTGGFMSLYASEHPDGLEWSIERITGNTELESSGEIYSAAEEVQSVTAVLPDYGFKDENYSGFIPGTSFSGVVGSISVILLCFFACYSLKFIRKKTKA